MIMIFLRYHLNSPSMQYLLQKLYQSNSLIFPFFKHEFSLILIKLQVRIYLFLTKVLLPKVSIWVY